MAKHYLTDRDVELIRDDHARLQNLVQQPPTPRNRAHPRPNLTREVHFGKPTAAYSSGATMTLDPCDVAGADLSGRDNVTVYVQASKASYSTNNSTTVGTSTVVPYVRGTDGNWYVMGQPRLVITDWRVDTSNLKFQVKTRDDWGPFCTSESAWVDKHTGDDCSS
jgi:hypothetical protein